MNVVNMREMDTNVMPANEANTGGINAGNITTGFFCKQTKKDVLNANIDS